MKKSMLAMMIWVIITLVEANTNDHTATPNDLVEPDYVAEVKYIHCLIYTFESCQNYYKESNNLLGWLEENALTIFDICTRDHNLLVTHHIVKVAKKYTTFCLGKKEQFFCLEAYFLKCYEEHLKEHDGHFKNHLKEQGGHFKEH